MKKILILGASYYEIFIINSAKKLGYYTIVTDNRDDLSIVPAKQYADESWNLSWTDIDSLKQKCIEKNISGVIAGFSEFRVESMIKLTNVLKLPCWLTMEQLDITRDKRKFKDLCLQFNVPCVHEYACEEKKNFPVIIKPTDRGGSIGINVAYNDEDFLKYYETALSLSPSKNVVIEDFISDGVKFDAYYLIKDDNAYLIATNDTIMCDRVKGAEILQKAWSFPSCYEEEYKRNIDGKVKKMLKGIGLKNGYITISAFYCHGQFYVFETGFRLSGELSFNYYKIKTGFDYMDYLVDFSMGKSDKYKFPYKSTNNDKVVVLNYFGKDGIVSKIDNVDKISMKDEVLSFLLLVQEGEVVHHTIAPLQKLAMCTLYSDSSNKLKSTIDFVNEHISIKNEFGNDMIYEKLTNFDFLE